MNFNMAKRFGIKAMLGLWMAVFAYSAEAQVAAEAEQARESASISLIDQTLIKLENASFNFGVSYLQMTYKSTNPNAASKAQITDNGAANAIMEFNSDEKALKSWPLRGGNAVIGWNINASASTFDTHYQLVNSAVQGRDIGTKVSGGYIGVAPTLFMKIGPLYPGRDIFWKVSYGIGPALFQGSGTANFVTPQGDVIYDVGSSSAVLALYQSVNWQFQVDRWYVDIMAKILSPQGAEKTSLEAYGVGLAYRFGF